MIEVVYNSKGDKVTALINRYKQFESEYYYNHYQPRKPYDYKNFDFTRQVYHSGKNQYFDMKFGFFAHFIHHYTFKGDILKFWPTFVNFAVYEATSMLGISKEHLNHKNHYIRAIFRFHVVYHVLRIATIMQVKLPGDDGFNFINNYYSSSGYQKVIAKYGDPKNLIQFQPDMPNSRELTKEHFIPDKGVINNNGLIQLNETICNYFYLVISSQVGARVGFPDVEAIQIFRENFLNTVEQEVNTTKIVSRYQGLLFNAITPPDYVIWPGCYMVPSNAGLSIKKTVGYNDMLVKADLKAKPGDKKTMTTTTTDNKPTTTTTDSKPTKTTTDSKQTTTDNKPTTTTKPVKHHTKVEKPKSIKIGDDVVILAAVISAIGIYYFL